MKELGVSEPAYVNTGFKSVAVDVGERMVQLFDAAPEATLPGSVKSAWALSNMALQEI